MNKEIPAKEGFVSFRGYQVWYRVVGDQEGPGKLPLLCLHGGPGATHDYLEPFDDGSIPCASLDGIHPR